MYIMYIDESGDTAQISRGGKDYLVLAGCVIHEHDRLTIEKELRHIKVGFYQNPDIEIKSNFLRYANPDLEERSPLKLNDRKKYDELGDHITKFLIDIPVDVFSVVIHKPSFWDRYPSKNPYDSAYQFLIERFQYFLSEKNELGIAILDPREGQVNKHYIGTEIDNVHHNLRFVGNQFGNCCERVVERVLFSSSDLNVGIQIADLFCYPIFHIFQYNKTSDEYWRFREITNPKLYRKNGKLDGVGLKFFPNKERTKKDLRFFSQ